MVVGGHRLARPIDGGPLGGQILQHVDAIVEAKARDHDAGGVRPRGVRDGRVDRHHDALEIRRVALDDPVPVEPLALPQGAGRVVQQLAVEFLTAETGVLELPLDGGQELRREVGGVVHRPTAGDDDILTLTGEQVTDQLHRLRRGGADHPRAADAQAELQHVPRLAVAPRGQLVGTMPHRARGREAAPAPPPSRATRWHRSAK